MTATDRRSDPDFRAVAEDQAVEAGGNLRWIGRLTDAADAADDAAAAAAAADAADAAAADTDDDAADVADDAAADAAAIDDADAAAIDDASDADRIQAVNRFFRGDEMRDGLLLLTLPGRYWSVTRVGWARRVAGDEWELVGAVTVSRTGSPVALDVMAARGLPAGHKVTTPAETPELLHRLTVRRVLVANEKAWAKHCPRPETP